MMYKCNFQISGVKYLFLKYENAQPYHNKKSVDAFNVEDNNNSVSIVGRVN